MSTDGAIDYDVVVVVVVEVEGEIGATEEDESCCDWRLQVNKEVDDVKKKEARLQSRVSLDGWSRDSTTGFNGQISKPMAGSEQRWF